MFLTLILITLVLAVMASGTAESIAMSIAGVAAPFLAQWIKRLSGASGNVALIVTVAVSAVVAVATMYFAGEIHGVGDVLKQISAVFTIATLVYKFLISPPSAASVKAVAIMALVGCLGVSQLACGPPSKKTIEKLYAGAHVVATEIQTNITLPDQLLAEKVITAEQLATVKKFLDQALSGAQTVEQALATALTVEKPSLGALAPLVADIIANLRGLTSLVNNERVQRFFAAVEIGLRVLGSYFALQISQARSSGYSDGQICASVGLRYDQAKFDLLATAYDGSRFDEWVAALSRS